MKVNFKGELEQNVFKPSLEADLKHKNLLQILSETNFAIKVDKQSLNSESIKSIALKDKPPVIYVSCLGSLDDHGLEFNLYFEKVDKGEAAVAEEMSS